MDSPDNEFGMTGGLVFDSDEVTRKKGFFGAIISFLTRPRKKKKVSRNIAASSRFGYHLEQLEPDDPAYGTACEAVSLCDESVSVISRRIHSIEKIKKLDEQMAELECFNKMDEETAKQLSELITNFNSLRRDKNSLKYQITDFDSSLTKLEELEEQAENELGDIRDAEEMQRIFKQDIGYLQGEKAELEYERESVINSINLIYKFTIGMASVFAAAVVALVLLYVFAETAILLPLTIITILVTVSVAMLYALRKRLSYELALNTKKQNRAVDMINRKNAVYAHYTNFLTFEYKKFKVKNSDMLKSNLRDYGNYKYLTKRFDSIRNIMFQTEERIAAILHENNISAVSASLEDFVRTFSIDDKRAYYKELQSLKKNIEVNLQILDRRHEQIWEMIQLLKESDTTEKKVIDLIVQSYVTHVSEVLEHPSPDDENTELTAL